MKSSVFKKLIIVIGSVIAIAGVSLFAYWMSTLNAPPDKETEIGVVIGIGDGSGVNLFVKEDLDTTGLKFVPRDRLEHDSIGDNNVSSYVFDVNVSWAYTETPDLAKGKEEKGVLLAIISRFDFYDISGKLMSGHLTLDQQAELASLFVVELGYKDSEGNFTPETEDFYIDPNGIPVDPNPREYQEVHLRLTFKSEPHDKVLRELIINENFVLEVILKVERVEILDKP